VAFAGFALLAVAVATTEVAYSRMAVTDVPLTLGERVRRAGEVVGAALGRAWGARTSPVPRERARSAREVLWRLPSPHLPNQPIKERHLLGLVKRALDEGGSPVLSGGAGLSSS
jgi:hypothetical protein